MIERLETRAGQVVARLLGAGTVVGISLVVGRMLPTSPMLALLLVFLVVGLGIAAANPAAIAVVTIPLLVWGGRLDAGGIDLSVSDAVLAVATLVALIFVPRPFSKELRTLLWLSGLYQFATLFTVLANPDVGNTVEWFHAWMLVSGALIVGWTAGRSGYGAIAISMLISAIVVIALGTILQGVLQFASGSYAPISPAFPFSMHKNFAGNLLAIGAVIAYAQPVWLGWRRRWAMTAFWIMAIAMVFTQSRQALISAGAVLMFVALRDGGVRRSKTIILAAGPAIVFAGTLVRDQIEEGNPFNSVFQRLTWFEDTIAYWQESPWIGHGLRFWNRPGELEFQPPNAELEVIASTGVVGLIAFVALIAGTLLVLWKLDPAFGILGLALVLTRVIQSQFDLFWSAVLVSIPFAIVGVCLGVESLARDHSALIEAELRVLPLEEGVELASRVQRSELRT